MTGIIPLSYIADSCPSLCPVPPNRSHCLSASVCCLAVPPSRCPIQPASTNKERRIRHVPDDQAQAAAPHSRPVRSHMALPGQKIAARTAEPHECLLHFFAAYCKIKSEIAKKAGRRRLQPPTPLCRRPLLSHTANTFCTHRHYTLFMSN